MTGNDMRMSVFRCVVCGRQEGGQGAYTYLPQAFYYQYNC
jgi:hypothetical protein